MGWAKNFIEGIASLADDAAEALARQFADAPNTAANRRALRTAARQAAEPRTRRPQARDFAVPREQAPSQQARHPRVPEGATSLAATNRGGRRTEPRVTEPNAIAAEASRRARAEARARRAAEPSAAARRSARAVYTEPPITITQDPELAQFSLRPGSVQSVTEQAAELGVPVTGRTPFFAQHPSGYSSSWGGNAPDPTTFTAEYRERIPGLSARPLSAEDFPVGAGLMPLLGDASAGNRDVVSVMGTRLTNPVSLLAGGHYGLQEGALGHRGVWSSGANVVENQAKAIQDWRNANEGQDVLGMHVNMGASGSDFSHQTGAVLANLIPNLGLSGDELRAVDDYIRAGAGGLPDFEGFAENPALGLFDILQRPGSERKRVTQRLSNVTKQAQAAGVPPHLGALARLAVADRDLRLAPQGSSGFGVVRFDPTNFLRIDPELLSGTKRRLFEGSNEYGGVLGGPAELLRPDYSGVLTGDFLGQTERLLPAEIPFRSIFDRAAQFTREGDPTTAGMRFTSFKTDPNPVVTITPEIQDAIGDYLYRTSGFDRFGWADGGRVDEGKQIVAPTLPLGITSRVKNPDGSTSTVRTMSIGTDQGEVLIPTVYDNRQHSEREAIKRYEQTGGHFGVYSGVGAANRAAQRLHDSHARKLAVRR